MKFCLSPLFYNINFALITIKSPSTLTFVFTIVAHLYFDFDFHIYGNYNLVLKHFDIANQLILFPFWHAIFSNYALYILFGIYIFTLLLVPQSRFHKLSLHIFILNNSQIYYNDTWCSYTPLQYHVLYTLSGRGVTIIYF